MGFELNEISKNAMGGTELQAKGLTERLPPDLLDKFQIIPSRVRTLDPTKVRILHLHDMPEDPEARRALSNGGWRRFHKLVCVSHWQMQRYVEQYQIPWEHFVVLHNSIEPIPAHEKPRDKIRLIYTSTPQRGLDVLASVYEKLLERHDDIELEVFSSFKLYGWENADEQFKPLFDALQKMPGVTYHGAKSNEEVREALQRSHIFAYPSCWTETFCLCLAEAMSAGLVCVHPNYGCLFETAANMTWMYQWREEKPSHAAIFAGMLDGAIQAVRENSQHLQDRLASQKSYVDFFYSWRTRVPQWEALLRSLENLPTDLPEASGDFVYRIQ